MRWAAVDIRIYAIAMALLFALSAKIPASRVVEHAKNCDSETAPKISMPSELIPSIHASLGDGRDEPEPDCEKDPSAYSAWSIGVRSNGSTQIVVSGPRCECGATGNCPFFVFGKTKDGYKIIARNVNVAGFWFLNSRTRGYRDLVTQSHNSAFDGELDVFTFDGHLYRQEECFDFTYLRGSEQVNSPIITPCRKRAPFARFFDDRPKKKHRTQS